jgi:predicted Zn-dependent protease
MSKPKSNWTLDGLKHELGARKEVKAWIITQEHVHRRERYFMLDGATLITDQDREVSGLGVEARVIVHLPAKPGRQGEITKKFFPSLPLAPQLDAAIDAASQTDHQAWSLPGEIAASLPQLSTSDPRMAEDLESVIGQLTDRIGHCVAKKRNTAFNSAELFLSVHDRELHLSNGLTHRSSQSRVYSEAAYSFARKDTQGVIQSDEYLNTRWAVSVDDLPLEQLFDETSERAEHSLDVVKPETGKYPVIVDAEVLAVLFNNHVSQLSAANSYNGLPFVKVGDELITGATGDLLTITLDPTLSFGADTTALSDQGVMQKPLKLVERNRVVATSTDKRYADYLSSPASTVRGNVVVEAGKLTRDQMTRHAPRVVEILQFSGLFADPNSGTFSSEIRLAKLYNNEKGQVTYLKGGSLSGSFVDNFKGAQLSSTRVKHAHFSSNSSQGQGYYGPDYAMLSDVSIVG